MNWHVRASKTILHQLWTRLRCRVEQLHSSHQPSPTKQNSRTVRKWNPDTKQDSREAETETGTRATKWWWWWWRGGDKMPIAELSWMCWKTIVPGIWVNNSVWLSSCRSLSVNAVSPIRRKCACVCAVKTLRSVWLWVGATVFFFSLFLPLLSCLSGLDLSPQSMSLFPVSFEEITVRLLQKTSVKWKGTDNKRVMGGREGGTKEAKNEEKED